jgi:hypothetical protein
MSIIKNEDHYTASTLARNLSVLLPFVRGSGGQARVRRRPAGCDLPAKCLRQLGTTRRFTLPTRLYSFLFVVVITAVISRMISGLAV